MDVDARVSEDHCGPVMIQEHALADIEPLEVPDPWSGWAKLVDPPPVAEPLAESPAEPVVAPVVAPEPPDDDLVSAVAQLAAELADERRRRTASDVGRREAEERAHAAEMEGARAAAELETARSRISELERDRDEVIRRAEELLSAVRERADQRLATELDAASRHWSELLDEERRRVETLDSERAALLTRMEDAWLAVAVLRRSRPLRPRVSGTDPTTVDEAEEEVLEVLEEHEADPAFAAESPDLASEIESLRQRLRARHRKPAGIDAVEDGVDQLRESRLARDADSRNRRRR
jgi:hypothetical protein